MRLWFYGHFARHGGCYTCTFWDILSLVNLKLSLASWLLSDIFLGIIIYKIILCLHAEFLIYMHQSINVRNFRMHWGLDMCSSQNKVHLHCLPYTSEAFLHKHKSTGILSNLTTNFVFPSLFLLNFLWPVGLSCLILSCIDVWFARWNINEVTDGSHYHASTPTMLVVGPNGLASIR